MFRKLTLVLTTVSVLALTSATAIEIDAHPVRHDAPTASSFQKARDTGNWCC